MSFENIDIQDVPGLKCGNIFYRDTTALLCPRKIETVILSHIVKTSALDLVFKRTGVFGHRGAL